MEPIQDALSHLMNNESFRKRYEQQKKDILSYPPIQVFLNEHKEIDEEKVERNLTKLLEYKTDSMHCTNCPGLEQCPNLMKGYTPKLLVHHQSIHISYEKCGLKVRYDEEARREELIQSLFMPKEIMQATFKNIDLTDPNRSEAIMKSLDFVERYRAGEPIKGLYFYGKFGVGKTYLLGALANELAIKKNVASLIVYAPEFFREMKQSIQDNTLQEKIDVVKEAPILMLDDIGAESMSSWIRDDVLGVILQYRMMEKLPTMYTSNKTLDELEVHFSLSTKGDFEELKAKRIMERIRHLTTPVYIGGENRRIFK